MILKGILGILTTHHNLPAIVKEMLNKIKQRLGIEKEKRVVNTK